MAACGFAVSDTPRFISSNDFSETYFILFMSNYCFLGCPAGVLYAVFAWKMYRDRLSAKEREGQLQEIGDDEALEVKGLPAFDLEHIVVLEDVEKRSSSSVGS